MGPGLYADVFHRLTSPVDWGEVPERHDPKYLGTATLPELPGRTGDVGERVTDGPSGSPSPGIEIQRKFDPRRLPKGEGERETGPVAEVPITDRQEGGRRPESATRGVRTPWRKR